mgnify:CR=1 FL=1
MDSKQANSLALIKIINELHNEIFLIAIDAYWI